MLRILPLTGRRELDNSPEVGKEPIPFFVYDDLGTNTVPTLPDVCVPCVKEKVFDKMGLHASQGDDYTSPGGSPKDYKIGIPSFMVEGTHGFSVQFWNNVSSIRYDIDSPTMDTVTETVRMLDAAPQGSGEWVEVPVANWEINFVDKVSEIQTPILAEFSYTLPETYGSQEFACDYVTNRWYLPTKAFPVFKANVFAGTVQRVVYYMNNTDTSAPKRPPCIQDFPQGTVARPNVFKVGHCPDLEEGTYEVNLGVYNELDGWHYTEKNIFEVLSKSGPIVVDDYAYIKDVNEPKDYEVRLENAGKRTCVAVNWADGNGVELYGNLLSCRIRYPSATADTVKPFNLTTKTIHATKTYGYVALHCPSSGTPCC